MKQRGNCPLIRSRWLGDASMTHPTLHAPSSPSSLQSTSTISLGIKATLLPWPASCQATLGPEANIPTPRQGTPLGSADLGLFWPPPFLCLQVPNGAVGLRDTLDAPRLGWNFRRCCRISMGLCLRSPLQHRGRQPGLGFSRKGSYTPHAKLKLRETPKQPPSCPKDRR